MNRFLAFLLFVGFLCVAEIRIDIEIHAEDAAPPPELPAVHEFEFEIIPLLPPAEQRLDDRTYEVPTSEPDGSTECSA